MFSHNLVDKPVLNIVWASDSGQAMSIAHHIHNHLDSQCIHSTVHDITEVHATDLTAGHWLFIVSTWGAGDPPTCAYDFWEEIKSTDISLAGGCFSIIGLGSHRYPDFAGFGHTLKGKLSQMQMPEHVSSIYIESSDIESINIYISRITGYIKTDNQNQL